MDLRFRGRCSGTAVSWAGLSRSQGGSCTCLPAECRAAMPAFQLLLRQSKVSTYTVPTDTQGCTQGGQVL